MILRRIAQHMKQQHWTGVFIELVIVVVGVFIGLQVNNWNAARVSNQNERFVLREMRSDLIKGFGRGRQYAASLPRDGCQFHKTTA